MINSALNYVYPITDCRIIHEMTEYAHYSSCSTCMVIYIIHIALFRWMPSYHKLIFYLTRCFLKFFVTFCTNVGLNIKPTQVWNLIGTCLRSGTLSNFPVLTYILGYETSDMPVSCKIAPCYLVCETTPLSTPGLLWQPLYPPAIPTCSRPYLPSPAAS